MKWVWTALIGLVGWLIYDWLRDKPGAVSNSVQDSADMMGAVADGIIEKQNAKKPKKWIWLLLGSVPVIGTGLFFLFRKKKPMSNLFNLGYLGQKAPAGSEFDSRYLAGCAKARRESLKMDFAKTQGATVAGLPIESVMATFGKKKVYDEGNFRKAQRY